MRAALPADWQVESPDLPGFGDAPPLAEPSCRAYVDALSPLVRADTHLVGHDYGGLLAAMIAAERPVASLTLSSTALGLGWLPAVITAWPPLHWYFYRAHAGRRWLAMGVGEARREEWLRCFSGASPALMEGIARRLPVIAGHRLRPETPTLCLWGDADRSVPVPYARLLAARLGATLTLLPGLRHYGMWEDPERYAAALTAFWERAGERPRR